MLRCLLLSVCLIVKPTPQDGGLMWYHCPSNYVNQVFLLSVASAYLSAIGWLAQQSNSARGCMRPYCCWATWTTGVPDVFFLLETLLPPPEIYSSGLLMAHVSSRHMFWHCAVKHRWWWLWQWCRIKRIARQKTRLHLATIFSWVELPVVSGRPATSSTNSRYSVSHWSSMTVANSVGHFSFCISLSQSPNTMSTHTFIIIITIIIILK